MKQEQIRAMEPGRKLDSAVARVIGRKLNFQEAHVCPACGWETEDLERSSRCQACWANGDRVTMGEKEEFYDFHPSTEIDDAFQVLGAPGIMDQFQIGVYPTSFGSWIARPFMAGFDIICAVQAATAAEAICKSVLISVAFVEFREGKGL